MRRMKDCLNGLGGVDRLLGLNVHDEIKICGLGVCGFFISLTICPPPPSLSPNSYYALAGSLPAHSLLLPLVYGKLAPALPPPRGGPHSRLI